MTLPQMHQLRLELNNEVHARPPPLIPTPSEVTYLALLSTPKNRKSERAHLETLCARFGVTGPGQGINHFQTQLSDVTLYWERHTEFARYLFVKPSDGQSIEPAPLTELPPNWLSSIPGELIVATRILVLPDAAGPKDADAISRRFFAGNSVVGSGVVDGSGRAATDFVVRSDGYSRLVLWNAAMSPLQVGRTLQRLIEIDSYRMMLLLALPVARGLSPFMTQCDRDLTKVAARLTDATPADEPELLQTLLQLEAEIQRRLSDHHFRFSASAAYYDLVAQRTKELREVRAEGMQTFGEFMERRLAPANSTCRSVAAQLVGLSERVGRATQSLATRTALTREAQNQALLETMARRAELQLRLQETVEGLSVAAITYYLVGLLHYFGKGLKEAGTSIEPEVFTALAIPVVFLTVAYGLKRTRAKLKRDRDH